VTVDIGQALKARLTGYAGLSALIGSRVYPLRLPQGATLPAVTYQRISNLYLSSHDNAGGTARPRFQFNCWGLTYASAQAVNIQLRAALNGYKGTVTVGLETLRIQGALIADEREDADPDSGLWWISADYFIWYEL